MKWKKKRKFTAVVWSCGIVCLFMVIPLYVFMYAVIRECEWLLGLLIVYCGMGAVICERN